MIRLASRPVSISLIRQIGKSSIAAFHQGNVSFEIPQTPCFRLLSTTSSNSDESFINIPNNAKNKVFDRIAIIGAGKMAHALLEPMIKKGVQPAENFLVYDVSNKAMEAMNNQLGVKTADSIQHVVDDADLIILAVKPQNMTDALYTEMKKGKANDDAIILSIIAGKTMDEISNTGFNRIVRSMPNTPAMIGQGMTVWSCTPNLNKDERSKIREVLNSCGKSVSLFISNKCINVSK